MCGKRKSTRRTLIGFVVIVKIGIHRAKFKLEGTQPLRHRTKT
jgi:hypothetical protein